MADPPPHDRTLKLPLAIVTVAFGLVLLPVWSALMWAVIIALLFMPLHRRLCRAWHGRAGWAALATLAAVTLTVILPLLVLLASLGRQVSPLADDVIDPLAWLRSIVDGLPGPLRSVLERYGLNDVESIRAYVETWAGGAARLFTGRAWSIGQGTLDVLVSLVVALYVAFFLLRDGQALSRRVWAAVPLHEPDKQELRRRFAAVIRATVKGNFVVAAVQGALGGVALALLGVPGAMLWGTVMAVLSLLPAVGVALAVFGTFVIGLVDNLLRPKLVGRDTKLPDWLVLVTTIGGISLLGINGFVIGPLAAALFVTLWGLYAGRNGS